MKRLLFSTLLLLGLALAQTAQPQQSACVPAAAEPFGVSTEKKDGFPKPLEDEKLRTETLDQLLATIWLRYMDSTFGGRDWEKISAKYKEQAKAAKNERAFYDAMRALVAELDGESVFISSAQIETQQAAPPAASSSSFVGVGMLVTSTQNRDQLIVQWVLPDGPAAKAGLKARDRILAVDGKPCPSTDKVRGQEGTNVVLTIKSPGTQPRDLTIGRARVTFPPSVVEAKRLSSDAGVGYLWIGSMGNDVVARVGQALTALGSGSTPLKGLVLDFRGFTGSNLGVMEQVISYFAAGLKYSFEGPENKTRRTIAARTPDLGKLPLAVLVDRNTGDSATVSTAILQKRPNTVIVGEPTDKGGVFFGNNDLPDGSILIIAEARLVLDGNNLKDDKVVPGVAVTQDWLETTEASDPYIKAALEALGKLK